MVEVVVYREKVDVESGKIFCYDVKEFDDLVVFV